MRATLIYGDNERVYCVREERFFSLRKDESEEFSKSRGFLFLEREGREGRCFVRGRRGEGRRRDFLCRAALFGSAVVCGERERERRVNLYFIWRTWRTKWAREFLRIQFHMRSVSGHLVCGTFQIYDLGARERLFYFSFVHRIPAINRLFVP